MFTSLRHRSFLEIHRNCFCPFPSWLLLVSFSSKINYEYFVHSILLSTLASFIFLTFMLHRLTTPGNLYKQWSFLLRNKEIDRGRHNFFSYVEWSCSTKHVTCFLSLSYYLPRVKYLLNTTLPKTKINIPMFGVSLWAGFTLPVSEQTESHSLQSVSSKGHINGLWISPD